MADIDLVLERLVMDTAFRAALADDPAEALRGYDLTAQDLQLLAGSLDDGDDAQRSVEQRTSKSAMVGLLASLTGGGGGGGAESSGSGSKVAMSGSYADMAQRTPSPVGNLDPSPASKADPFEAWPTRWEATRPGQGADELTGRPVGQPQASGGGVADQLRDRKSGSVIMPPDEGPEMRPVGQPTATGGGVTDRLNSQPQGSVTVPVGSSESAMTTDPPKLDAASKDTAYLSEYAPLDGARATNPFTGGMKAGDTSISRAPAADLTSDGGGWTAARGDSNPQAPVEDAGRKHVGNVKFEDAHVSQQAPAEDDVAGKMMGAPKISEYTGDRSGSASSEIGAKTRDSNEMLDLVGRSAAPEPPDGDGFDWIKASADRAGEDVAPAGNDPAQEGVKRYTSEFYVEGASTTQGDSDTAASGDAAPPADPQGDGSGDRYHDWKWVPPALSEEAPPAGAGDGDGDGDGAGIKIEIGAAGQRGDIPLDDSPPSQTSFNSTDAFLTVEDE